MIKHLLTLLLLTSSINSYPCDCKTISKETEYVKSDFIFLGRIINVTDKYFEVKTLEVFKGATIQKIISYTSSCSIYPKKGEIWLLYSKKNDKNSFFISTCGNSRSFTNPFVLNDANLPSPPSLDDSPYLNETVEKNYFKIALLELRLDIANLRQIRNQKNLIRFNNNYKTLKSELILLKSFLIVEIILLLFFIFLWSKFKLSSKK